MEFQKHERAQYTCCLDATDDEVEIDAELFPCLRDEPCPVAEARDDLWPENREAWGVFQRCVTRFLVDTHTVSVALSAACDEKEPDERLDLCDRLSLMYSVLYPPKKP